MPRVFGWGVEPHLRPSEPSNPCHARPCLAKPCHAVPYPGSESNTPATTPGFYPLPRLALPCRAPPRPRHAKFSIPPLPQHIPHSFLPNRVSKQNHVVRITQRHNTFPIPPLNRQLRRVTQEIKQPDPLSGDLMLVLPHQPRHLRRRPTDTPRNRKIRSSIDPLMGGLGAHGSAGCWDGQLARWRGHDAPPAGSGSMVGSPSRLRTKSIPDGCTYVV